MSDELPPIDPDGWKPSKLAAQIEELEAPRNAMTALTEILAACPPELHTEARRAIMGLLNWICSVGSTKREHRMKFTGRRAIALMWLLKPGHFQGVSLSEVSRMLRLPKQRLSQIVARASQQFGIINRGQAHAWNRGIKTSRKDGHDNNEDHEPEPETDHDE